MANPENQERDEATASEQIPPEKDDKDKAPNNIKIEDKDEKKTGDGDKGGEVNPEAPKENEFSSPTKAVASTSTGTPKNKGTPSASNTAGQNSAATTPAPATPAPTTQAPTTPASHPVPPVPPYGYPPYPYYPAMPPYPPPPTMPVGMPHQTDPTLTSATNPYQYTDVATLHDPVPDTRRNRGGVTEPFPEKLHRMLEDAEHDGLQDVVSFFSHGRAFAIHKPRRFVKEIMPKFFRQTRLTSFQRQLNLYGFRRISQGPDNGGYYHELFLKGRPGLCVNMKRTKVKGASKLRRDPDSEPNFYTYPPISSQETGASTPGSQAPPPTPPARAQASPPAPVLYPGYAYPPPPYPYAVPMSAAPYTAAQQSNASTPAPVYPAPFPPYPYPYPYMYPPHPPNGHMPPGPQAATPQTSPLKTTEAPKTPDSSVPAVSNKATPASAESVPATTSVHV